MSTTKAKVKKRTIAFENLHNLFKKLSLNHMEGSWLVHPNSRRKINKVAKDKKKKLVYM